MTLGNHREQNQGGIELLLNDGEQADLWQALQEPPDDGRLRGAVEWALWQTGLPN